MSKVAQAMQYMKRRSKLPSGGRIREVLCEDCDTSMLCWDGDPMLSGKYPYRKTCTQCKSAERAENRAIFGQKVPKCAKM